MSEHVCKECGEEFVNLQEEGESTGYCDSCAQTMLGEAIDSVKRWRAASADVFAVLRKFMSRVEKGEVRSKRTYADAKAALDQASDILGKDMPA